MVFWNASLIDMYQHFGRTCCVKGKQEVFQNVDTYLQDYWCPMPGDRNLVFHHQENLKS
jgi:hypothetical protein